MGKNQSASGLTNIIQYDNNGNVSFVSGSTTLMQISSSGAITTTGVISGSNALSSSYALNSGLLNETGSVGFATTGSLLTVSSSQQQISASQQQMSASLLTLTASFNAVSASQQQISSSQQQISASLLNVIAVYATTGSNSFRATQSITGSLTVTGQIIAQTLNVQQVTSSIIYSSGSNNFGCDLNSRQTFTGSVLITGSLTIAGASSATSYSGATIFGSTIACSPIGCFATSCATAFIGGTMSGTTIYGSTAVCSPVGKFTTCIDAGSGTFSGNVVLGTTALSGGGAAQWITTNGTAYGGGLISSVSGVIKAYYYYDNSGYAYVQGASGVGVNLVVSGSTNALTIASTGIACFACTVCAPNAVINCLGAGAAWSTGGGTYQPVQIKSSQSNSGLWVESCENDSGLYINHNSTSALIGGSYRTSAGFKDLAIQTAGSTRIIIKCEGTIGIGGTPAAQSGGALVGSTEIAGILRIQGAGGRYFTSGDGVEISKSGLYSYNRGTSLYNTFGINDTISVVGGGGGTTFTANDGITIKNTANQYRQIYHYNSNGGDLFFWNGSNQAYLGNAGVWTNASDISIKKDIIDIKYGLCDLMNLIPRSYKMKDSDMEQIGFIAQEVEIIIPEVVTTDNKDMKGLSYGNLLSVAIKAIQEQQCKIALLESCLGIA